MRLFTIASAVLATILMAQAAPSAPLETRNMHHSRTASRITYYTGNQLKNPACGGHTPNSHEMIAAVKKGGHFKCHDRIKIKHGHRHVTVRVVDYCAGCGYNAIDLSTGAFSKLAHLDQGVISGAEMWLE